MDPFANTFEMAVEGLSRITGRGVMFTGHVRIGKISVGDRIDMVAAGQQSSATVAGIARTPSRCLVQSAEQGKEVGILVTEFKLDDGTSGVRHVETQYIPVNLTRGYKNASSRRRSYG